MSQNRNKGVSKSKIEQKLKKYFGFDRILWLNHGYLAGDDTDSHIDTLARFCDDETICYVKCEDENDEHFVELSLMERELKELRRADGKRYRLVVVSVVVVVLVDVVVSVVLVVLSVVVVVLVDVVVSVVVVVLSVVVVVLVDVVVSVVLVVVSAKIS